MKKILFILSAFTVILICCKTKEKTTTTTKVDKMAPDSADVSYAKTRWSDATKESLTKGYDLYIGNCGKCHGLPNPKNDDDIKLGFVVPNMALKANLNEAQGELILRYMLTKRNSTP